MGVSGVSGVVSAVPPLRLAVRRCTVGRPRLARTQAVDHLNANMEGEIVEGEIAETGEIAEAMEGEIVEGGAVEAVGDAIGEAEEERRRLEREARNKAARSLVLQGRLSSWS